MKTLTTAVFVFALAASSAAIAQPAPPPEQDVGWRHGNLMEAQALLRQAYDKLSQAQRANYGDLGGHVHRAKELLDQASAEIKAAAVYANSRR
jgi:hypothetical protein